MHIEAGVVAGTKMLLSYGTAVGVLGMSAKLALENIKDNGILSFILKSFIATIVVFCCFEVLPHYPVGVSEVHLILGTTVFLVFGEHSSLMPCKLAKNFDIYATQEFQNLIKYIINSGNEIARILTLADVSWKPNDNEMKNVSFDDYDWKKWKK